MKEDPIKVGRSVVAAFLLNRFDSVHSEEMLAYLIRLHLISPFEREALLKAGGVNPDSDKDAIISALSSTLLSIEKDTGRVTCYFDDSGKPILFGVNSDSDKDAMISALNSALISIEKDTGGVSRYYARKFTGTGRPIVFGIIPESDKDAMISALNSALLSIEKDTGGVICYFSANFNGSGKPMVIVMSRSSCRFLFLFASKTWLSPLSS
ncbi:hypothetical protein RND81_09G105900 [Saponaria officinalis]|uniref:Uncharacterized protein n=1 Tax=Saponaria officinalis TaxID=3572 RepID=A0AAW1IKB1_SAPOF